jgi:hypothetical protein
MNKEAGKRSEVPFSRREEGRELGEDKEKEKKGKEKGEREKRIERKVKEKECAALGNLKRHLFVMSFSLLVRVVKMKSCMDAGLKIFFGRMKWKFSKRREVISHLSQQRLLSKTWKQKAEWKLRLG